MVYFVVASFDVRDEHKGSFIAATSAAGRDSCADEPGTLAFRLVEDSAVANRFHLVEEYSDPEAFDAHSAGPHFRRFFDTLAGWGQTGPDIVVRGVHLPL